MKRSNSCLLLLFLLVSCHTFSQTIEETAEERSLEQEEESDVITALEDLKKHPMDLNTATEADLKIFRIITDVQIQHFMVYRRTAGNLIDIHELQAIPAWHPTMIRQLLPYVSVGYPPIAAVFKERLKKGDHSILVRMSRGMEPPKEEYAGSPEKYLLKYRYRYRSLLQYGITAEKDAGEKWKPDFVSFHVFLRQSGRIRALAIGDFSVNMGQGLIQYNSMTAGKTADVLYIKQQTEVLKPHTSSAEYNFQRGLGITAGIKNWEATGFISSAKLSASLVYDSSLQSEAISAISVSGLHRTDTELARRKNTRLLSAGASISYKTGNIRAAVNSAFYNYSLPLRKGEDPYNHFDMQGRMLQNYSVNVSYTFLNAHFFSEAALSGAGAKAVLAGMMASLHPNADLALLYRRINADYHAPGGKGFSESSELNNEKGLYAGFVLRPVHGLAVRAYADVYHNTFVRYRKSAPTYGKDILLQVSYQPAKRSAVYARYQQEFQLQDAATVMAGIKQLYPVRKRKWRLHYSYVVSPSLRLQARAEFVKWCKEDEEEEGVAAFLEGVNKVSEKLSITVRALTFETAGFESRIYTYEPDVPFSGGLPFFYGKGFRYLVVAKWAAGKELDVAIKWSQTVRSSQNPGGAGSENQPGSMQSELRLQLIYHPRSR